MAKGWVYVMSNESMPGLVKIGHSNDPDRRAKELESNTGVPTPFIRQYEAEVWNAQKIEQNVHHILRDKRVSKKEFFRCSVDEAIEAVKKASEDRSIKEKFHKADREKAEAFVSANKEYEKMIASEEDYIRDGTRLKIMKCDHYDYGPVDLWGRAIIFGFLGGMVLGLGLAELFVSAKDNPSFVGWTMLVMGIIGACVVYNHYNFRNSSEFKKLIKDHKEKHANLHAQFVDCLKCNKKMRVERRTVFELDKTKILTCPHCSTPIPPHSLPWIVGTGKRC